MDKILLRLETGQDAMAKALKELKMENAMLRNEIFGVGTSGPSNSQSKYPMECKSLWELVEDTQNHVKAINQKIFNGEGEQESLSQSQCKSGMKRSFIEESDDASTEESDDEEYPVEEIRSKTLADELNWLKENFNKLMKTQTTTHGKSFVGTTVQSSSSSIPSSQNVTLSCSVMLSNFLDDAVTDFQYYIFGGLRNHNPSKVLEHLSEVFSFTGDGVSCSFVCSWAINRFLRLAIRCYSGLGGSLTFGIGFFPVDVHTDCDFFCAFDEMQPAPDFSFTDNELIKEQLELYVSHGDLFARGHMTLGPRSVVHVEIFEMRIEPLAGPNFKLKLRKIEKFNPFRNTPETPGKKSRLATETDSWRFLCNIEITNCLNVKLANKKNFYCNSENNDFIPSEVLPFRREKCFVANDTKVESMFCYEIDTTDLTFVIALKVEPNKNNSFAAEFLQRPVVTDETELKALMDPKQWKTHLYRKYATANEDVQVIQIRNILAEVEMTDEDHSSVKIRIYAV